MKKNSYLSQDGLLAFILIIAILVIDQIVKIEVKTNMCLGESVRVTNWFYISFIENNGMAYGMTFFNKLVLSVFRIIAVGCIGWYMHKVLQQKHSTGYIVVLSMIMAGAAGNIIDSMFYGLIFNASSPFYVSYLVPFGSGYASFLQGKVVDMFYFPLIVTTYPDWVPFKGGQEFIFFSPVFNFADACISVGVVLLLLFFRKEMEGISETVKGAFKKK
ncbi:lipoprotein signal peptidase [Segatella paludivivens]|uniref:lipoprotein signal peptidase n=1 Tax=Segatella paludivivens TaxID=185294 RepID=UPI0003796720|nr:lipoprotein signal peptidase [Segatella paludivivens]